MNTRIDKMNSPNSILLNHLLCLHRDNSNIKHSIPIKKLNNLNRSHSTRTHYTQNRSISKSSSSPLTSSSSPSSSSSDTIYHTKLEDMKNKKIIPSNCKKKEESLTIFISTILNNFIYLSAIIYLIFILTIPVGVSAIVSSLNQYSYDKNISLCALLHMSQKSNTITMLKRALSESRHRHLLNNYQLNIVWKESQCDMATGMKGFFEFMHDENTGLKPAVIADDCTHVYDAVADSIPYWGSILVTYTKRDGQLPPNVLRIIPSDVEHNRAMIKLLQSLNYSRVATVYQYTSRHTSAHNDMTRQLEMAGIDVIISQGIHTNASIQMINILLNLLKSNDAKIIVTSIEEELALTLLCHAYEHNMINNLYLWTLLDTINLSTIRSMSKKISTETSKHCTNIESLMKSIDGIIYTEAATTSFDMIKPKEELNDEMQTILYIENFDNIQPANAVIESVDLLDMDENAEIVKFAFDSLLLISYTLDSILKNNQLMDNIHKNQYLQSFIDGGIRRKNLYSEYLPHEQSKLMNDDFISNLNMNWSIIFKQYANKIEFDGITKRVKIVNGDRVGEIKVVKIFSNYSSDEIMLRKKTIALYNGIGRFVSSKNISLFKQLPIKRVWRDNAPFDHTKIRMEKLAISKLALILMSTISCIGYIMAIMFLIFNLMYRKHRFVKMSSPHMNNLLILGCMFSYIGVVLMGFDQNFLNDLTYRIMCSVRGWAMSVCFTLAYGAMFSKTLRVHIIFTNIKANRRAIKDYQLFIIVVSLLFVDFVILTTWQIVDPMQVAQTNTTIRADSSSSQAEQVVYQIKYCTSNHLLIWICTIFIYKGVLLVFGCFLAWETRHVSIPALNDSKHIGLSVYAALVCCVCAAAISLMLRGGTVLPTNSNSAVNLLDAAYLITGGLVLTTTSFTLGVIFTPKILEVHKDPEGKRMTRATLRAGTLHSTKKYGMHHRTKIKNIKVTHPQTRNINTRSTLISSSGESVTSNSANKPSSPERPDKLFQSIFKEPSKVKIGNTVIDGSVVISKNNEQKDGIVQKNSCVSSAEDYSVMEAGETFQNVESKPTVKFKTDDVQISEIKRNSSQIEYDMNCNGFINTHISSQLFAAAAVRSGIAHRNAQVRQLYENTEQFHKAKQIAEGENRDFLAHLHDIDNLKKLIDEQLRGTKILNEFGAESKLRELDTLLQKIEEVLENTQKILNDRTNPDHLTVANSSSLNTSNTLSSALLAIAAVASNSVVMDVDDLDEALDNCSILDDGTESDEAYSSQTGTEEMHKAKFHKKRKRKNRRKSKPSDSLAKVMPKPILMKGVFELDVEEKPQIIKEMSIESKQENHQFTIEKIAEDDEIETKESSFIEDKPKVEFEDRNGTTRIQTSNKNESIKNGKRKVKRNPNKKLKKDITDVSTQTHVTMLMLLKSSEANKNQSASSEIKNSTEKELINSSSSNDNMESLSKDNKISCDIKNDIIQISQSPITTVTTITLASTKITSPISSNIISLPFILSDCSLNDNSSNHMKENSMENNKLNYTEMRMLNRNKFPSEKFTVTHRRSNRIHRTHLRHSHLLSTFDNYKCAVQTVSSQWKASNDEDEEYRRRLMHSTFKQGQEILLDLRQTRKHQNSLPRQRNRDVVENKPYRSNTLKDSSKHHKDIHYQQLLLYYQKILELTKLLQNNSTTLSASDESIPQLFLSDSKNVQVNFPSEALLKLEDRGEKGRNCRMRTSLSKLIRPDNIRHSYDISSDNFRRNIANELTTNSSKKNLFNSRMKHYFPQIHFTENQFNVHSSINRIFEIGDMNMESYLMNEPKRLLDLNMKIIRQLDRLKETFHSTSFR
ncbi:hypothetical protein SNEBB_008077 [Seison nebaliae]|nr:hypothetical protein SNEBB_008077 [Seison nebaliae]